MILFKALFNVPPYEQGQVKFHEKQAADKLGEKILEHFPATKISGEFVTMEYFNDLMKRQQSLPSPVEYVTAFTAFKQKDYENFKGELLSLFTTLDGANQAKGIELHNLINQFEGKI